MSNLSQSILNHTIERTEFKPFNLTSTSTPFVQEKKDKKIISTKSERLVTSLVHNTSKIGKISKRKNEKLKNNIGIYQSYDLIEKEKFRELIKSNVIMVNKKNSDPLVEKYTSSCKISGQYTRKINIPIEPTIIELDLTKDESDSSGKSQNSVTKKAAQKRHTTQPICNDENFNSLSSFETISKVNRRLSEFEKKMNEKLSKGHSVLEIIIKSQTKPNALVLQEARYNQTKIQKLDRERIERDLAYNFSQKLHLEASKLSGIVFEEQEKLVIEDEFPELTDEQELLVKNYLVPYPQEESLVSGFGADITRKDIQTLKGLNWLNDEIINFYMSLICERNQNEPEMTKVYAFTTFFYPKLVKDGYNTLRRWTRKVDIFSYDLILIPVHLGLHWTLSCIDFACKEIRYYDSMNGNNNECLIALRNYLKDEFADKKKSQFDFSDWNFFHVKDVPQQMNGSDCGMFTCKYAEFLSRGKTVFNFNQSHMPYFRKRMVWEIVNKRLM